MMGSEEFGTGPIRLARYYRFSAHSVFGASMFRPIPLVPVPIGCFGFYLSVADERVKPVDVERMPRFAHFVVFE